jgi:hypothetical protein
VFDFLDKIDAGSKRQQSGVSRMKPRLTGGAVHARLRQEGRGPRDALVVIHQRNLVSAADGTKSAFPAAWEVAGRMLAAICGNVSLLKRRFRCPCRAGLHSKVSDEVHPYFN